MRLLFELIVEFVLNLSVNDINNVNNVNDVNFLVMLEVDFDLMKKVKWNKRYCSVINLDFKKVRRIFVNEWEWRWMRGFNEVFDCLRVVILFLFLK